VEKSKPGGRPLTISVLGKKKRHYIPAASARTFLSLQQEFLKAKKARGFATLPHTFVIIHPVVWKVTVSALSAVRIVLCRFVVWWNAICNRPETSVRTAGNALLHVWTTVTTLWALTVKHARFAPVEVVSCPGAVFTISRCRRVGRDRYRGLNSAVLLEHVVSTTVVDVVIHVSIRQRLVCFAHGPTRSLASALWKVAVGGAVCRSDWCVGGALCRWRCVRLWSSLTATNLLENVIRTTIVDVVVCVAIW